MFFPFNEMPGHSRIWIYQADRFLSDDEIALIKELAYEFVNDWTSHKQTLHASFEIVHNLFLVFAVDEQVNDTGGCSIDKAFQFVQYLEKMFRVKLLDRMQVALSINSAIEIGHINDAVQKVKSATQPAFIFNNLISQKRQLQSEWMQPVEESWLLQMM